MWLISRENQATVQKTLCLQERSRRNIPLFTSDITSWNLDDFLGLRTIFPRFYKSIRKSIFEILSPKNLWFWSKVFFFSLLLFPLFVPHQRTQKQSSWDLFPEFSLPVDSTRELNRWRQQCGWEAEQARAEGPCCPGLCFWFGRFQSAACLLEQQQWSMIYKGNFQLMLRGLW